MGVEGTDFPRHTQILVPQTGADQGPLALPVHRAAGLAGDAGAACRWGRVSPAWDDRRMTIADVPAGLAAAADASLRWHPGGPFNLLQTLGTLLRGNGDPAFASRPDGVWMSFTTPDGPATLRLTASGDPREPDVDAQAWGPGAEAAISTAPRLLGSGDDWSGFDRPRVPRHAPPDGGGSPTPEPGPAAPVHRPDGRFPGAYHPRAEGHRHRGPPGLPLPDVPLRHGGPRRRYGRAGRAAGPAHS